MIHRPVRFIMRVLALIAFLVSLLAVAVPAPALAATPCDEEISGQTVVGSLTVERGDECLLSNTTVIGSVFVEPGGRLIVSGGSTIEGRVEATDHRGLEILDSTVRGSVTVTGGTRGLTNIFNSSIGGRLTVTDNEQDDIFIDSVRVGGSATITDNTAENRFSVLANTIGGSLRCSGNTGGEFLIAEDNTTILGRMIGDCT